MSEISNALTEPPSRAAALGHSPSLERALQRQRSLAWLLSTLTLGLTVGFFGMMTLAAQLMSHVAFGHSVTVANVAAVSLILIFLLSTAAFSWHASRVDTLLRGADLADQG